VSVGLSYLFSVREVADEHIFRRFQLFGWRRLAAFCGLFLAYYIPSWCALPVEIARPDKAVARPGCCG
jgi:hypothetical protein